MLFPREFIYEEMLIYSTGDTRVMIVSKELYISAMEGLSKKETLSDDEKKFKEMISRASEVNKIDANKIEFEESVKEYIQKNNYEIIEHEGWYELLPLNLIEKKEKKASAFNLICSQATFFLVVFGALTYSMTTLCLEGDWHFLKKHCHL